MALLLNLLASKLSRDCLTASARAEGRVGFRSGYEIRVGRESGCGIGVMDVY